jgi:hypothetical protein
VESTPISFAVTAAGELVDLDGLDRPPAWLKP